MPLFSQLLIPKDLKVKGIFTGTDGRFEKAGFKRGGGDVAADFGVADAEIDEDGERDEQRGGEEAEEEVFHESSLV